MNVCLRSDKSRVIKAVGLWLQTIHSLARYSVMKSIYLKLGLIPLAICLAFAACQISCSSKPDIVAHHQVQMPVEYPTTASDTLKKLSSHVPADSQMLAFGSYGSLTEAIATFRKWKLVNDSEVENLLKDLGTHYLLNPGKLESWFKAGFHTGSGFVAGYREQSAFIVLDIIDPDAFKSWWDNFLNEEFGRPRYAEEQADGSHYIKIHILNRDFATMIYAGDQPVTLVFGEGIIAGSPDSFEAAKKIYAAGKIQNDDFQNITKNLKKKPVALWIDGSAPVLDKIPQKFDSLKDWCDAASVEFSFADNGPDVRVSCPWSNTNFMDKPRGKFLSSLVDGNNGNRANAILKSNPSSAFRVLINPEAIEPLVLQKASQSQREQYDALKDKLTQRLIKLNVTEQIIYNMGAAWAVIYDVTLPPVQNPTLKEILTAQNAALFIPFRDAEKSNGFFAKVNIIKKFVPEDKAVIDLEDEILHAKVKYDNQIIHVGYRNGLLAVSTDSAWNHIPDILNSGKDPDAGTSLAKDTNAIAGRVRVSDMTTLLGIRFAIIKEQIGNFLSPFDYFEFQASTDKEMFECSAQGVLK